MKKFQRRIEDFTCDHCGAAVTGDGYTNHCPKCLYSKHVDNNPGDRANSCHGLMAPIRIQKNSKGDLTILHRCEKCGFEKPNKMTEADDFNKTLDIMRKGQ